MRKKILRSTKFSDMKLFKRGKVRDVYDLEDKLLRRYNERTKEK